ncbi:hypothetical protein [Mesorhizobium sp. M0571]|uniref:hypothetical protein n=1 Tax=Mesorhizobium sp. M0571 TaxID=2956960 RepID=UPI003334B296
MTDPAYVLGNSAFQLTRLARQERLICPCDARIFAGPASRSACAFGSGAGAVAFIAAELVGSSGFKDELSCVAVTRSTQTVLGFRPLPAKAHGSVRPKSD